MGRTVGVAVFQTEVHRPRDREAAQVRVCVPGRRRRDHEDIDRRSLSRVGHRRKVDQILDRAAAQPLPHPRELFAHLLLRRVRRPIDADAPQVREAGVDRALRTDRRWCRG